MQMIALFQQVATVIAAGKHLWHVPIVMEHCATIFVVIILVDLVLAVDFVVSRHVLYFFLFRDLHFFSIFRFPPLTVTVPSPLPIFEITFLTLKYFRLLLKKRL